jgi:hypothetical protein
MPLVKGKNGRRPRGECRRAATQSSLAPEPGDDSTNELLVRKTNFSCGFLESGIGAEIFERWIDGEQ